MASSIVVGSIFLAGDQLLGMEQLSGAFILNMLRTVIVIKHCTYLPVSAIANLIQDRRLQVDKDCTWYVFVIAGFAEKGVEGVVNSGLVGRHVSTAKKDVSET